MVLAHILTLAITALLPITFWVVVGIWGLILVSLAWVLSKRNPGPIAEIHAKARDDWRIKTSAGRFIQVTLLPASTVWDKLIVLQFRSSKHRLRRYSAVIFSDSLSASDWHRLRRSLNYRS